MNFKKVFFNLGDTVAFTILSEPIAISDLFGNIKHEQIRKRKIGKILEIKIDLEINENSYIVKCENKIFLLEEKELNAEN